jgi:hypothetical protein
MGASRLTIVLDIQKVPLKGFLDAPVETAYED